MLTGSFDNCQWQGDVLSGSMTIDLYDFRFYSAGGLYEFTDFQVTDTNGTELLANGKLIYSVSRFSDNKGNVQHVWGSTLDSLVYQTSTRNVVLTDSNTYFSYCVACWSSGISNLSGTLKLRTSGTGSNTLTVSTVE